MIAINKKSKMVILPCDCKCCMFVVEKTQYEDGGANYNIAIQDSRYDHNYNTLWGRIKRACCVLFGKPIYYNDVYIEDEDVFRNLVSDMEDLLKSER